MPTDIYEQARAFENWIDNPSPHQLSESERLFLPRGGVRAQIKLKVEKPLLKRHSTRPEFP